MEELAPLTAPPVYVEDKHEVFSWASLPPFLQKSSSTHQALKSIMTGLLLGLGIGSIISYLLWIQSRRACTQCSSQFQALSPVLEDIQIKYHDQHFNGSFVQQTVYRLDAGPEVDAAWDALGVDYVGALISKEQATRYGIPKDWVHMPLETGGQYVVNVQVVHHLHCLNLLRKGLYFNFEYYVKNSHGAFANRPAVRKAHITHCLDSLRQVLMCNADVTIAGWRWFRNEPGDEPHIFPDFNGVHRCRNFDDVRRWAERNQVTHTALANTPFERPKPGDRVHFGLP